MFHCSVVWTHSQVPLRCGAGLRSEASLAAAEETHKARMVALEVELKELKNERESQKDLYYSTISAVNEQVRPTVGHPWRGIGVHSLMQVYVCLSV